MIWNIGLALLTVLGYWFHPDNQKRREFRARIKKKKLFRKALDKGNPDTITRLLLE